MAGIHQQSLQPTKQWILIARGVRRINHSQFADDTLLLGGASQIMASRFKLVLDQYGEASRGIINKNKSQIYAWNIKASTLSRIASLLQFPFSVDWKFFKYLGTPISLKSLPGEAWHVILQKIKDQFEVWGEIWLNPTGRLVLVKSVLSSFPIFQFSTLLAPMGIKKAMAQIIHKFLWQGGKI
jgi:hypothetical protein